jgi:dihydroorotate dehydrogenase
VLVKSGEFPDVDALARFLRAIDGHATGAVLINAPSRQIVTEAGLDAFGPSRRRAGVMGGAIFDIALVNVRGAAAIISDDQLSLKLVAVGGASNLTRVRTFLDSGACAALAAWPAAWNPYLASEIRNADSTI